MLISIVNENIILHCFPKALIPRNLRSNEKTTQYKFHEIHMVADKSILVTIVRLSPPFDDYFKFVTMQTKHPLMWLLDFNQNWGSRGPSKSA